MSNWQRRKLADISTSCLGKMLDKEKNRGTYYPYLANYNVRWGKFDLNKLQLMKFEEHEHERYGLEYGDLVICEGGEPGRCAVWRNDAKNIKIQKALHRLRVNKGFSYDFLYYRMLLASRTGELNKYFIGSTIKHLTGVQLKQIEFDFPVESIQHAISSTLRVLDEKIELNNRINAELEAMAKTLYDYWFVQFDFPDANGKPYKTSGGKMEYNATLKREIPVGWKIKKISEIALVKAGGDKPSNCVNFRSDEYSTPIFSNGISSEGLYGYTDIAVVNKPSITVSARGTIGYSVLRLKPFFPIIRLLVLTPYQDNALKFLEETIKRFSFENSGSVQQQLTVPQISEMSVLYPTEQLLNIYTKRIWPLIKKMELIKEQNSELQQLRDWLLPLLMNGQVTVK